MGEYFSIVCHDCRKRHVPNTCKLREIALNPGSAAEVGWFAVIHAGHRLELCGDERTGTSVDVWAQYAQETLTDDPDVRYGQERLTELYGVKQNGAQDQ